jgi:5'-AMP-activated protein kinase regulatory gamma subunit
MGIVVCVEAWISLGHSLKLVRTPGCLHQLLRNFRSSFTLMPLLAKSLGELGIGTWSNIATVSTSTLLTDALNMLKTYSCLPVIDEEGLLVDIYTRTDIISLAKSNAYSRLQFEEVTVMQALSLSNMANPGMFGSGSQFGGMSPANMSPQGSSADFSAPKNPVRISACLVKDDLKSICRRMTRPGVRRLLVVDPDSKKLLGIVTISDVCRFLFSDSVGSGM